MKYLSLYFHSLRYLKAEQLFNRVWRAFAKIDTSVSANINLRKAAANFYSCRLAPVSMLPENEFVFLNERHKFNGWNDPDRTLLWLYNLHYFDDLNSSSGPDRKESQLKLILSWIENNEVNSGVGWDAYPTSLRIVNWIKFILFHEAYFRSCPDFFSINLSLKVQARILEQKLEFHLLGNHLFANAKALLFAGLYFDDDDAERWLFLSVDILNKQLAEQVLSDGGHFELSPMYHSIIVADLIDLLTILDSFPHHHCYEFLFR